MVISFYSEFTPMRRGCFFYLLLCLATKLIAASAPFFTPAKEAILYDATSGMVLFEKNADVQMVPSSMTKALLIYIVFMRLKSGELSLNQTFDVSARARNMEGSRMFLERGTKVSVDDLIRGTIVTSGNDACITLEEGLFPTPEMATYFMNQTAQQLGLVNSHFKNTTGWPDKDHYSTARDILKIGIRTLKDFPQFYKRYYSQTQLTHNKITQFNRNPLVHQGRGDGLKTGRTEEGGYGLLGASTRNGRRLIFVVNGLNNESARAQTCFKMLNWGFSNIENFTLFPKNAVVKDITIEGGVPSKVGLTGGAPIIISCLKNHKKNITFTIERLDATPPLPKGAHVANIIIKSPGLPETSKPLFLTEEVKTPSLLYRIYSKMKTYLFSFFKFE